MPGQSGCDPGDRAAEPDPMYGVYMTAVPEARSLATLTASTTTEPGTRMNPNQQRWIITYAKVDDSGEPVFRTDTTIVDTDEQLRFELIGWGVPGFVINADAARRKPDSWFGNSTRVTWRFARPSLPEQRDAFMTELRGYINTGQHRAMLDAVAERGVYLGKSARWQNACRWFAEQERDGRPIDWIASQGMIGLGHAM